MNSAPNIIYILADDMGYGDLSCLNADSKIRTRYLDELAGGGMIFRDAHATSAVCTPSRFSILTGRYNWRSRLKKGVMFGYSQPLIGPGRMTVASMLKSRGYATGCVGKWHLGWRWAKSGGAHNPVDYSKPIADGPTAVGFDNFFGISASLDMPPYVYVENDLPTAIPTSVVAASGGQEMWREGEIASDFAHADVLQRLTDSAIGFVERSAAAGSSFFLYFPLTAPHTPILPSEELRGASQTNAYGDFCLQVDDVVGQILRTIDRLGIAENTIIVFTADNGCSPMADFPSLAEMGHHPSHHFRGHKADIYEGGHRVPLIVRWPARIKLAGVCDEVVCLVDLLAMCAEIVGYPLPSDAGEDSISNLTAWIGESMESSLREATVHHSMDGSFSVRRGQWKLEMCPGSGGWSWPRPGYECVELPPMQLYDLDADIGERRNVIADHPEVVEQLSTLLAGYVRAGRSTPGPPMSNVSDGPWPQLWWMDLDTR